MDEDPTQSLEYLHFIESMVQYCRCTPEYNRPCDGVLAGGLCDDLHSDINIEIEEDYENNDI